MEKDAMDRRTTVEKQAEGGGKQSKDTRRCPNCGEVMRPSKQNGSAYKCPNAACASFEVNHDFLAR